MRGLDTNVLVRFLLRDDGGQAKAAKAVIESAIAAGEPLLLSLLTVLETEWVLRASVGLSKAAIVRAFKQLLEAKDLLFEGEEAVEEALYQFENGGADFADCLMIAQYRRLGCSAMPTFDRRAAKITGGQLLSA